MMSHHEKLSAALAHFTAHCFFGDASLLDNCPKDAGIYLVAIELKHAAALKRPSAMMLKAGLYVYAGSAHGPGGLKARLSRHLKKEKTLRWHIDQLTTQASSLTAFGWLDGTECDLVKLLSNNPDFFHPVPGFGSSDCSDCTSHLLGLK
ncbi:GIY-YIG nuclease family protein [uncultured Cohaesibacter sp.]|uniref:GIY-YIG nuclease family protein n=1 Tax=uncultured Cohaesibacter sp. TaxID=1002546 RepID=UPI00293079D8|nr:GIY-YIG nuclease family protein [uncultured Cohaesibacter sp.]